MTTYLLSTQALLDVLAGVPRIHKWLSATPMQFVQISAVSIGQALELIQQRANPAKRNDYERQLDKLLLIARANQNIIPFDEEAAKIWTDLKVRTLDYKVPGGGATQLSSESRMVVASTMAQGAQLVEAPQPYHAAIPGLIVVNP